ncbi:MULTISPECIES: VOC family protein [Bhargavaea]|uniref:VOC family protein n=1 Tax=Bhargavaea changchunensis TaxID=2134037 RepID=A0ABW2NDW1_9BACL|nr:glyoxalase/bleomycin resistance/extradiol dioxygenase family protein [Bhargavaea sp. CC-171006]
MIKSMYPYLVTNGNGQEAVRFYEKALQAEVLDVKTFGDMPSQPGEELPEEMKDRVLNAHLKVGSTDFMISDTNPGDPHTVGDHLSIALSLTDPDRTRDVFGLLSEGGEVIMEVQETFWSPAYGQVKDRFGILWQINTVTE